MNLLPAEFGLHPYPFSGNCRYHYNSNTGHGFGKACQLRKGRLHITLNFLASIAGLSAVPLGDHVPHVSLHVFRFL
jgi:hypothetical protein